MGVMISVCVISVSVCGEYFWCLLIVVCSGGLFIIIGPGRWILVECVNYCCFFCSQERKKEKMVVGVR